jgi:hypothetical protein
MKPNNILEWMAQFGSVIRQIDGVALAFVPTVSMARSLCLLSYLIKTNGARPTHEKIIDSGIMGMWSNSNPIENASSDGQTNEAVSVWYNFFGDAEKNSRDRIVTAYMESTSNDSTGSIVEASEFKKMKEAVEGGKVNLIVATSVMAFGVNIPSITMTLFPCGTRSPRNFLQECGRSGRLGGKQASIVFRLPQFHQLLEAAAKKQKGSANALHQLGVIKRIFEPEGVYLPNSDHIKVELENVFNKSLAINNQPDKNGLVPSIPIELRTKEENDKFIKLQTRYLAWVLINVATPFPLAFPKSVGTISNGWIWQGFLNYCYFEHLTDGKPRPGSYEGMKGMPGKDDVELRHVDERPVQADNSGSMSSTCPNYAKLLYGCFDCGSPGIGHSNTKSSSFGLITPIECEQIKALFTSDEIHYSAWICTICLLPFKNKCHGWSYAAHVEKSESHQLKANDFASENQCSITESAKFNNKTVLNKVRQFIFGIWALISHRGDEFMPGELHGPKSKKRETAAALISELRHTMGIWNYDQFDKVFGWNNEKREQSKRGNKDAPEPIAFYQWITSSAAPSISRQPRFISIIMKIVSNPKLLFGEHASRSEKLEQEISKSIQKNISTHIMPPSLAEEARKGGKYIHIKLMEMIQYPSLSSYINEGPSDKKDREHTAKTILDAADILLESIEL